MSVITNGGALETCTYEPQDQITQGLPAAQPIPASPSQPQPATVSKRQQAPATASASQRQPASALASQRQPDTNIASQTQTQPPQLAQPTQPAQHTQKSGQAKGRAEGSAEGQAEDQRGEGQGEGQHLQAKHANWTAYIRPPQLTDHQHDTLTNLYRDRSHFEPHSKNRGKIKQKPECEPSLLR